MPSFSGGIPGLKGSVCFLTSVMPFLLLGVATVTEAQGLPPLRLALSPTAPVGEECLAHGQGGPATGGKAVDDRRPVLESEHRPLPVRTYHFNAHRRLADVKAYVRHPDGTVDVPELRLGANPQLTFKTPFGDGPNHGAHNVYVVEQGVEGDVLVVRTAKWIVMHHSCGWGHDQKFNEQLTQPQPLESIPMEILISDLWDGNFHFRVTTGQKLSITVLRNGHPLAKARVSVRSEQGWVKEVDADKDGVATFQLIRDYYPTRWQEFHRTRRGEFLATATYEAEEHGEYKGIPYGRVRYITTHPWTYGPSSWDYASYSMGLLIAVIAMALTGGGVFIYRERRKKPYQEIVFEE